MESGSLSRISRVWALQVLAFAVLVHDLISPSKFLEQEYFDYFCLLLFATDVNQTLTLTTPASYTGFAFLGFSTEAQNFDAVGDVTVNFSDLTSTTYDNVLDLPDWYTGVSTVEDPLIFNSQGRVQTATGMYNQSLGQLSPTTGGQLYANMLTLSAGDQLKTVQSITFSITGAAAEDRTYILAVSAVPEPGSVALIVFGGLVLAGRRTRRLQA